MANATENFVTVCDSRTLVRRGGAGQPLLFLHGAGGFPGWEPFLGRLANHYEVIAPDHPGYGQSDTPAWLEEVSDLAQFYLELLKHLDLTGVHVIGHSLGGWIALEMATRSTARIKSLTALSSAGIRVKNQGPPDIFAMDPDELVRTLFHDSALIEQQLKTQLTPEQIATMSRNRVTSARLGWNPRFFNPKLRKWLRRIDVPTHIIWGAGPQFPSVPVSTVARRALQQERLISNAHYDEKIGHATYNLYLDQLELCDQLGFDGVAVNEHHQTPYCIMPSPIVTAAALSRRTKGKIAILGSAFCLRDHPLTLAEEHAMIDNITGGRLITGFVRGIGAEYSNFGVNPTYSQERHLEAHDLVVQAWTRPGPFAFEGKHYHFEYVNVWPRPYQKPHPPIWIPSQGSSETITWAAHPDRKYLYMQNFNPYSAAVKYLNEYRRVAEQQYGYEAQSSQLGWAGPCYVAPTDEQAMEEAREAIEFLFNKTLKMPVGMFFPPGYTSVESMQRVVAGKQSIMGAGRNVENLNKQGVIIVGSPETVRRRILEAHRELGFSTFMTLLQFGSLDARKTENNIRLFAREVLPALQEVDDRNYEGFRTAAE